MNKISAVFIGLLISSLGFAQQVTAPATPIGVENGANFELTWTCPTLDSSYIIKGVRVFKNGVDTGNIYGVTDTYSEPLAGLGINNYAVQCTGQKIPIFLTAVSNPYIYVPADNPPANNVPTGGLVAHYEARNGATAGSWTDLSGSGNTLTAVGNPAINAGGAGIEDSVIFDNLDGYVDTSPTGLPTGNSPRTAIAVWKMNSTGQGGVRYGTEAINQSFGQIISGTGTCQIIGWGADIATTQNCKTGLWQTYAVTHDGSNVRQYMDNVLFNTTAKTFDTQTGPFILGSTTTVPNIAGEFAGYFMWNRVLSSEELTLVYQYIQEELLALDPNTPPPPVGGSLENIAASGELDTRTVKAFPGAEGYGQFATGGRGGAVVKVTTTADNCNSGDGQITWREAITSCGDVSDTARTIVFNVGGLFDVDGNNDPYQFQGDSNVTVACQTAPSPVVFQETIHMYNRSNVIVRHCINRNNGNPLNGESNVDRGWDITSGSSNMIFDHVSISWTEDSNWLVYQGAGEAQPIDFTLSHSNLSRGDGSEETTPNTNDSAVGPVCLGNHVSTNIERCSFLYNYAAHNNTRNNGLWTATGEIKNSVVYNWWDGSIQLKDIMGTGLTQGILRNNLIKKGPMTDQGASSYIYGTDGVPTIGTNNWVVNKNGTINSAYAKSGLNVGTVNLITESTPFVTATPIQTLIANNSTDYIKCNGASAWGQDPYDKQYWDDMFANTGPTREGTAVINRDYTYYTSQATSWPGSYDTDNDGMSDEWEISVVGDITTMNSTSDQDGDSYTDLEEFINQLAQCPHVKASAQAASASPNGVFEGTSTLNPGAATTIGSLNVLTVGVAYLATATIQDSAGTVSAQGQGVTAIITRTVSGADISLIEGGSFVSLEISGTNILVRNNDAPAHDIYYLVKVL